MISVCYFTKLQVSISKQGQKGHVCVRGVAGADLSLRPFQTCTSYAETHKSQLVGGKNHTPKVS